jgi:uncharacterized protein (DUF1330 family)
MSVVVIVQGIPRADKAETLKQYQGVAASVIGRFGGQPIARGKALKSLHGPHAWVIGAVIRFPDMAAVEGWYEDPEYQKVLPLRDESYEELEITIFQE